MCRFGVVWDVGTVVEVRQTMVETEQWSSDAGTRERSVGWLLSWSRRSYCTEYYW